MEKNVGAIYCPTLSTSNGAPVPKSRILEELLEPLLNKVQKPQFMIVIPDYLRINNFFKISSCNVNQKNKKDALADDFKKSVH